MSNSNQTAKSLAAIFAYLFEKVILTWQFICIVLLFVLGPSLIQLVDNVSTIKGKGFEFTFERTALNSGLKDSDIAKLKDLDYDGMEIFLISGGRHGNEIGYSARFLSANKFLKINKMLDSIGLIKVDWAKSYIQSDSNNIESSTTEEGVKLHDAMIAAIFSTFRDRNMKE